MRDGPALIMLHGGGATGEAEGIVARARLAAAGVSARAAREGGFASVVLATNDSGVGDDPSYSVDRDAPGEAFSLQKRVLGLVEKLDAGAVAVMGAGALPFLKAEDYAAVRQALAGGGDVAVTNNFYSSDLTAWSPATAIAQVGALERDNVLPRRLRDEAGCEVTVLPRSVRTAFDLDTPADLVVLALSEATPVAIRAALPVEGSLPLAPYRAMMPLLCDPDAEILVAGRVGSATWAHLERETACRVRLVSEERGMASVPEGHTARSLVGRLLEELGVERFAEELASLADGVVLDTRVLLAHAGSQASREDRFQGDLLAPEKVTEPWLRDLTAALATAEVPVLAGGHSLLSGGLMALADQAWLENDRRLGIGPAPD
ncbi:MAG: hypothetical protein OXH07_03145 [Chloroflexi bacterium]|nr:hypothetical protein [Chloroflexota bacterium]